MIIVSLGCRRKFDCVRLDNTGLHLMPLEETQGNGNGWKLKDKTLSCAYRVTANLTCSHCSVSGSPLVSNQLADLSVTEEREWEIRLPKGWVKIFDALTGDEKHFCPECAN